MTKHKKKTIITVIVAALVFFIGFVVAVLVINSNNSNGGSDDDVRNGNIISFSFSRGYGLGGAVGYTGIPFRTTWIVALVCAIAAFIIAWNLIHSRYGQAFSAIRENEVAAAANGINVVHYKKMSCGATGMSME